jgi:putative N-acetyltransferase (TIGR04045 family)
MYSFQLATSTAEIQSYFALRHSIFVQEQRLFETSDMDEFDAIAYPIIALKAGNSDSSITPYLLPPAGVAIACGAGATRAFAPSPETVGIVRIYEPEPGLWYGGRLGVHADYRREGQIGKGLIYKAVTTANTWGCHRFLATVQLQNVRFFRRLHWTSLEEIIICDRPHHLMEADLAYYPATQEPRPALPFLSQEAS